MRLSRVVSSARDLRIWLAGWGLAFVLAVVTAATALADGGTGPYPH